MANKIITARFTKCGCPATGLTPTINVWELDPTNPAVYTQVVTDGVTTELFDGWYRYDFTTYDYSQNYIFQFDGGSTLPCNERYQYGGNQSYEEDIAFQVWEETATDHLNLNTTGLLLNLIKSDTSTIILNQATIIALIDYVRKIVANRNRIDQTAFTLTVYDDDGTTPLLVFNLKDFAGSPSINPIAERDPI